MNTLSAVIQMKEDTLDILNVSVYYCISGFL